ncbi:MAG: adenylate/guanylate cyclase domain-containing protein [Nitrospirae bacterium]|nr:adenylate/guanylate cyclase domain-containing protein [Nitrospirota bacterium]
MEGHNRTWLCTVVFLDVVGYTQRPVAQQMEIKERLRKIISESTANIAQSERTVIDTGDGAALCFMGDPEDALFVAMNVRNMLLSGDKGAGTAFQLRIGINLGPVKVVRSFDGNLNPLGDGINNAQRVMGFAEPNQILVSRSFYEVIANLSQDYMKLFHFMGTRHDKHVKEHTVYEIVSPGQAFSDNAGDIVATTTDTESASPPDAALPDASPPDTTLPHAVIPDTTPPYATPPGTSFPLTYAFDPETLRTIKIELTQYIGPMGETLVDRTAAKVSTIEELCSKMAAFIPKEDERARFLKKVSVTGTEAGKSASGGKSVGNVQEPKARHAFMPFQPSPWEERTLKAVESELTVYIGPIAKLLVKKAAQKTSDIKELYSMLAGELSDKNDRENFLKSLDKHKFPR